MTDGLLSRIAAAQWLGVSAQTLANLAVQGGGPRMVKLGRRVLYDPRDLTAWVEKHKRDSTSDTRQYPTSTAA